MARCAPFERRGKTGGEEYNIGARMAGSCARVSSVINNRRLRDDVSSYYRRYAGVLYT